MLRVTVSVARSRNSHCSKVMDAEHRTKFEALHRQLWCLHLSEKLSSGTKNPKQTNQPTKQSIINVVFIVNCFYDYFTELHITFKYWKTQGKFPIQSVYIGTTKIYPRSEMCHISVLTNLTLGNNCMLGERIINECPTKNLRNKEFALFGGNKWTISNIKMLST